MRYSVRSHYSMEKLQSRVLNEVGVRSQLMSSAHPALRSSVVALYVFVCFYDALLSLLINERGANRELEVKQLYSH